MKHQNDLMKERLQNVLLDRRVSGFETLLASMKSDLVALFSGYMDIGGESVRIAMDTVDENVYAFNIQVRTAKLFDPGKMIPWED